MTDPYKVLGVPTTATDDEVKQAYRRLAKKFHPDANPGNKLAEQRMKEINAAYDQIMNKDSSGRSGSGGYAGYGPFGGYGGYNGYGGYGAGSSNESDARMAAVRNYITYGRYREALNVLAGISDRTARWYYYSAAANQGAGNSIVALEHAKRAVEMEPDNEDYQELLERLENPGRAYGGFGRSYTVPTMNLSRLCTGFFIMQLFCMYMRFCCR